MDVVDNIQKFSIYLMQSLSILYWSIHNDNEYLYGRYAFLKLVVQPLSDIPFLPYDQHKSTHENKKAWSPFHHKKYFW